MRIVTVNGRSFFFESSSSTDHTPQSQPLASNHSTDEYFTDQTFEINEYTTEYYFGGEHQRSVPLVDDEILVTEERIMDKDLKFNLDARAESTNSPMNDDKYGKNYISLFGRLIDVQITSCVNRDRYKFRHNKETILSDIHYST